MKKLAIFLAALALAACTSSGPKKTLDEMATALQNNDPTAFLARVDLPAYAGNNLAAMTDGSPLLNSLNSLSGMLGLGSLDKMLNSVVDYTSELRDDLTRGVASGELTMTCQKAGETNCPWVASSLREAQIIEIGPNAAIAKVTAPTKLTSWLAMRKIGDKWLVVGKALLESDARKYALTEIKPEPEPEPETTKL